MNDKRVVLGWKEQGEIRKFAQAVAKLTPVEQMELKSHLSGGKRFTAERAVYFHKKLTHLMKDIQ